MTNPVGTFARRAVASLQRRTVKTFEPLHGWIISGERLTEADAFTARMLLIHHYRRVVLRDPLLPTALLPSDWPGRAARSLCGEIYRGLLPASEQWLDGNATNENGALPKPGRNSSKRFDEP